MNETKLKPSLGVAPAFPLLLLLSATIGNQRHDHWGHHSVCHKSATFDAPSTQIRQACKATRFPNVCKSILSDSDSLPRNPFPSDFILATANASAAGLQTIHSMIQSILEAFEKASNINRTNTARICFEVLSYSDRRLLHRPPRRCPRRCPRLGQRRPPLPVRLLVRPQVCQRYHPGLRRHGLHLSPLLSPAPASTRVFLYPSVPSCWASTHQDRTSSFRLVCWNRMKEDKGKGGPKRLESEREGELKG